MPDPVADLRDRDVLAALGQITEELAPAVPDPAPLADVAEARAALAALLRMTEVRPQASAEAILADDRVAPEVGRDLLSLLLADDVSRDTAADAVESPPPDEQLTIELALGAAIVLGALVTWLQTKVHIKIVREAGQTSFAFELNKEATDPETIKEIATNVAKLI